MAQQTTESHREGAEVYTGNELCKKKSIELLEELHLPRGLLPLNDMEEVGYNRSTGFVWLKQKKETTHNFKKIGRNVWYAKEVTAFVEEKKMKRMTGVKAKELLIWISLTSMVIEDPEEKKLTFQTPTGIGRTFPVSAFELEE
ncbi:hypothetical protein LUZ63_015108 [Rhynchospora breviuscula]|uniref:Uncharacterized protein n=1 Tax=Rhynchospora breviuscula TaxID=2022672 RepID=A0A9Q0CBQ5_9POAL|nr:hypothetical protein LUZ63_015108 [Rhynchospora breviuscula]